MSCYLKISGYYISRIVEWGRVNSFAYIKNASASELEQKPLTCA